MTQDSAHPLSRRRIILLTGMSGAGMSTALKTFEDLGFEAVDNLRQSMIAPLVNAEPQSTRYLAVAIDTRNVQFSAYDLLVIKAQLATNPALEVKLLYLDCADDALQQRFTETRRRHPLAIDRPVSDGIQREREILRPLQSEADHVIDTSRLTMHELRRLIAGHYRPDTAVGLTISVVSFSFRQGIPREADLLFDVRFLANPHWDTALRPMSGKDTPVADYIKKDPDYTNSMNHLTDLILPLLPRYMQEGKSYLTIAIGCTGGRHRSVFVAEELGTTLAAHGYIVGISHRDLERTVNLSETSVTMTHDHEPGSSSHHE